MQFIWNHLPQFGVVFLLVARGVVVIKDDLGSASTRKKYGIVGIFASELTYIGLLAFFLWWGGFWK